jgi:hypothetical protein
VARHLRRGPFSGSRRSASRSGQPAVRSRREPACPITALRHPIAGRHCFPRKEGPPASGLTGASGHQSRPDADDRSREPARGTRIAIPARGRHEWRRRRYAHPDCRPVEPSGRGLCPAQVVVKEGGSSCQGGVALVEDRSECLEAMRYPGCHVECYVDVVDRGEAAGGRVRRDYAATNTAGPSRRRTPPSLTRRAAVRRPGHRTAALGCRC